MNTGTVIKNLRKQHGLTQQELAKLIGVQRASIQKYEDGSVQNLKLETIQKLCQIFRVAPYAFVFPEEWEKYNRFYADGPDIYKFKALYTFMTAEGKEKIVSYAEDLSQIKKYVRKETDILKDLYDVFPWRRDNNGAAHKCCPLFFIG